MNNTISFTSSYRFPMTQPGVSRFNRESLKPELMKHLDKVGAFQIPNTGKGNGRISVAEKYDSFMEGLLKKFGFKRYQKFPLHDVSIEEVDKAVKKMHVTGDYVQKGMQKAPMKKNGRGGRR